MTCKPPEIDTARINVQKKNQTCYHLAQPVRTRTHGGMLLQDDHQRRVDCFQRILTFYSSHYSCLSFSPFTATEQVITYILAAINGPPFGSPKGHAPYEGAVTIGTIPPESERVLSEKTDRRLLTSQDREFTSAVVRAHVCFR